MSDRADNGVMSRQGKREEGVGVVKVEGKESGGCLPFATGTRGNTGWNGAVTVTERGRNSVSLLRVESGEGYAWISNEIAPPGLKARRGLGRGRFRRE